MVTGGLWILLLRNAAAAACPDQLLIKTVLLSLEFSQWFAKLPSLFQGKLHEKHNL